MSVQHVKVAALINICLNHSLQNRQTIQIFFLGLMQNGSPYCYLVWHALMLTNFTAGSFVALDTVASEVPHGIPTRPNSAAHDFRSRQALINV